MRKINAKKVEVDAKAFKMRAAAEADAPELMSESVIVLDAGVPVLVYIDHVDFDLTAVRWALGRIKYQKNFRSGGLPTISRIFGFSPRSTLRKDFCAATGFAAEAPQEHRIICDAGRTAALLYAQNNPELYARHQAVADAKVRPEWSIPGTPFTSGIINRNNQLLYHHDSGNFKDVWSAMFVFKKRMEGGHLVVPEYGLRFACSDQSLLLFDGQALLHGVTPMRARGPGPGGHRYSIVYYSLRQMWNCLTPGEELQRIRGLKTQREIKRARA